MKRVWLVGTVHEEQGLATASELFGLLNRLRPEVIFLEIPPSAFKDYVEGRRADVESTAARQYNALRSVDLVPVDLPTPEDSFFIDSQRLYDRIENASPEYCRLLDWHRQQVIAYGFDYLNSDHCAKLWLDVHEAVVSVLATIDDQSLVAHYSLWRHTHDLRDKAMMKSIDAYCTYHSFNAGVFLVGAAHRHSIPLLAPNTLGSSSPASRWELTPWTDAQP